MNNTLKRIAALSVGLVMAAGVGVGVGLSAKKSNPAKADTGDRVTAVADIVSGTHYYIGSTVSGTDYYWKANGGTNVGTGLAGSSTTDKTESPIVKLIGSGSTWAIQFDNGNYLSLASSKDNGKYIVVAEQADWTVTDDTTNNLMNFKINNYCLMKNSASSLNFGSYASGQKNVWLEEAPYEEKGDLVSVAVTGSMTNTSYSTLDTAWNPAGLVATATYSISGEEDVTSSATWTFVPAAPAEGVTSVVATATFGEKSGSSTDQSVTVTVAHTGTAEDPFTVAEGIAKCKENGTTAGGPWVVKGIISKVTTWDSRYPNVQYWISDDGVGSSTSNSIQCYRGRYLENADVTAENVGEFAVGTTATVTGNLVNYQNSTPEFAAGNYPLSLVAQSTGDIDVTFEPDILFAVGDTGTFTASTEAANPSYAFSSDDSSIMSVAADGSFEALAAGKVNVTVNVTSDDGNGEKSVLIEVAAVKSVSEIYAIAEGLVSPDTTEEHYKTSGVISSTDADGKARAINITDGTEVVLLYFGSGNTDYTTIVETYKIGAKLTVLGQVQNYNGTYEMKDLTVVATEGPDADSYSLAAYVSLDKVCETGPSAVTEELWTAASYGFTALPQAEQEKLQAEDVSSYGQNVVNWVARYERIVNNSSLENFMLRSGISSRTTDSLNGSIGNVDAMTIVLIISSVAVTLLLVACVVIKIRKEK